MKASGPLEHPIGRQVRGIVLQRHMDVRKAAVERGIQRAELPAVRVHGVATAPPGPGQVDEIHSPRDPRFNGARMGRDPRVQTGSQRGFLQRHIRVVIAPLGAHIRRGLVLGQAQNDLD